MKLTKKILSLVLAVALVLGSIAVAANAADYDGLAYEGSELSYKIEADKTEVKPGDTVKFSVYMKNNYYIGASGGEFFLWTKGVFNDITESDIVAYGIVAETFNVTPNYAPAQGMYPSTHAYASWAGYLSSRNANAGTVPEIISDYQLIYEITLTVKEDVTPGTEITFEMPAGSLKSAAQTGRKGTIYQSIAKSADNAAESIAYPETADVSAASVTITVASAVEYCDYSALETAVAKTPELAEEYYDEEEYAAWEAAVAAGNELLDAEALEKTDENQATIDNAAALVESTFAALDARYLDLTKLNNAVVACDEIDPADAEYYDATEYAAWEQALADAKAAQTSYNETMPATKQAEVDAIADELTTAYAALDAQYVDLTKLNNAVDACDEVEYAAEYYDAADYAAWETALAAAKAAQTDYDGKPATKQAEVDAIADELTAAYAKLNPSMLDLTALNDAIAAYDETEYAEEYYDSEEYAAWEQALADAQAGVTTYTGAANTAANQQAVADLAQALADAYTALDARFVDASAIAEAITAYGTTEYAEEYYDADEYAAYTAALAAAQTADFEGKADTEANRAAVAKIADDLKVAYEALDARFVDASAIAEAIAAYEALEYAEEYYDADEYAAWEAALAAAQTADFEGEADTEANRAAVAKIADDLKVAYEALDARILDTTPITDALAACVPEYTEEYYDSSAWANFQVTISSAATIAEDYKDAADTAENRELVQYYVDEINAWYAKLVPQFVSYEKLEKAVADYGTAPETEFYYTPDSWAAYEEALAAAKDANENRPEPLPAANDNNQAAVDAYADALEKAYNELEAAVCHIISVTPLQENYVVNDTINFAVLVEGTAAKIQIIKENGVTSTYDKNTSAAVLSVTDNGDGTETWVISRRIYQDNVNEYAKAKVGRNWDTGVKPFEIKCTKADYEVKSVDITVNDEPATSALAEDIVTVTIVTGPAAAKVMFYDAATGNTMTLSTPVTVNEDGTKVWVLAKKYAVKEHSYEIRSKGYDGVWYESDFVAEFTVTKTPISQVPSTGDVADAVYSATVAKKRILRDVTQTFTIETDMAAKAVRLVDADGNVVVKVVEAVSVDDVKATWTIEKAYASIGDYSYTVEALYGSTWIANDEITLDFTVIY